MKKSNQGNDGGGRSDKITERRGKRKRCEDAPSKAVMLRRIAGRSAENSLDGIVVCECRRHLRRFHSISTVIQHIRKSYKFSVTLGATCIFMRLVRFW